MKKKKKRRRSREQWLETALQLLSQEGEARIRVRRLSQALGVSTGSFYWHFRGRDDFVQCLIRHWEQMYTTSVVEQTQQPADDPKTRLMKVAQIVIRENMTRYDVAVRAWAAHQPDIVPMVRKADRQRLAYVGRLFADLGFRGADLEIRTRTFVTYYSSEQSILVRQSKQKRLEEVKRRVELLCRR